MLGWQMNVPQSTLDKIKSQFHSDKERKAAVIRVYMIEHPHPTWEHVSDVLYREGYHSVLERLQSLFLTGEHLMCGLPSFSGVWWTLVRERTNITCAGSSDAVYMTWLIHVAIQCMLDTLKHD